MATKEQIERVRRLWNWGTPDDCDDQQADLDAVCDAAAANLRMDPYIRKLEALCYEWEERDRSLQAQLEDAEELIRNPEVMSEEWWDRRQTFLGRIYKDGNG